MTPQPSQPSPQPRGPLNPFIGRLESQLAPLSRVSSLARLMESRRSASQTSFAWGKAGGGYPIRHAVRLVHRVLQPNWALRPADVWQRREVSRLWPLHAGWLTHARVPDAASVRMTRRWRCITKRRSRSRSEDGDRASAAVMQGPARKRPPGPQSAVPCIVACQNGWAREGRGVNGRMRQLPNMRVGPVGQHA